MMTMTTDQRSNQIINGLRALGYDVEINGVMIVFEYKKSKIYFNLYNEDFTGLKIKSGNGFGMLLKRIGL